MKTLTVISALLVIGAIFFMYQNHEVQASPVAWDNSTFAPRSVTLPNAVVLDIDNNGIADTVYTFTNVTRTYTFVKQFGSGVDNATFTIPKLLSTMTVTKGTIWLAGFNLEIGALHSCTATNTFFNVLTGAKGNVSNIFSNVTNTGLAGRSIAFNDTNGKPVLGIECLDSSGSKGSAKIVNNVGTIRNCAEGSTYSPIFTPLLAGCQGLGYYYTNLNSTIPTSGITRIYSWHTSPWYRPSTTFLQLTYGSTPLSTTVPIAPSVQLYNYGHLLNNGYSVYTAPSLWAGFFPQINTHSNQGLLTLNYRELGLTGSPYRFPLTDGVNTYVAYLSGSSLVYFVDDAKTFTSSPVKVFRLNNTFTEAVSNDYATVTGANVKHQTINGIPATNFTASLAYLVVNNEPDYHILDKSLPFSIRYELKCPANPSVAYAVASKAVSFGTIGFGIWLGNTGATAWSISNTVGTNELRFGSGSGLCDNKWRDTIWTYDGLNTPTSVKLYINGTSTAVSNLVNNLSGTTQNTLPFSIGAFSTGNSKMKGAISNVQLFNRVLSQSEVTALTSTRLPVVTNSVFNYTDRAMQYYTPDTEATLLSTLATTSTLTNHTYNIQTPTGVLDGGGAGPFTLTSGYQYQIPGIFRHITPDYSNDDTNKPIFRGPTTGLTQTNIQIKNSPTDFALRLDSKFSAFNGIKYVWALDKLTAGKLLTVDLPTNLCYDVYGRDISTTSSSWAWLGEVCATSSATNIINYIATLPIAFWEFTWGSSHNYTSTNNNLATIVRHSTTPYTYNVIVKHANGTVAINQTYSTSNLPDTRTFNVSSIQKPASLYIYSDSPQGSLIYSAYLGSPVSLASVASFFHTYFNYQGFDLLAFMPIIFAAMFTRNTVGIGVVMTVVCIATISWLSIVIIPDMWIMIMAVVAVIGLIGYRLGYPN